jgi:MSHA biogenesis protein MshM
LFRASKGVPRLINILAHKTLMAAFGEGARHASDRHVRLAVADTESIRPSVRLHYRLLRYLGLAASVTVACIGVLVWVS